MTCFPAILFRTFRIFFSLRQKNAHPGVGNLVGNDTKDYVQNIKL